MKKERSEDSVNEFGYDMTAVVEVLSKPARRAQTRQGWGGNLDECDHTYMRWTRCANTLLSLQYKWHIRQNCYYGAFPFAGSVLG